MKFTEKLTARFGILTVCLIVMAGMIMQIFLVWQEQRVLEARLREKATFINNFYSYWIADSITHKDDVALLQIMTRLEQDPEVVSIIVVDKTKEVRYHVDPSKVGTIWEDAMVSNALQSGDGVAATMQIAGHKALVLVSPLKAQGQSAPMGAVRIEFTFGSIQTQINASMVRFFQLVAGLILGALGLMNIAVRRWVLYPLFRLKEMILSLNPLALEANFQESPDEFGQVHRAMNDFIIRIKSDYQNQPLPGTERAGQERFWTEEMLKAFLPNTRLLIAGSDNRVISDSGDISGASSTAQAHLLDLITDKTFATLLTQAFQQESQMVQGAVVFQDKPYTARIWRIPGHQSSTVRTIIALEPQAQELHGPVGT